jgi:hypothetical protein
LSANVYSALIKVQKDMGPLLKDSKNPHFRNNYASLAAVIDTISEPLTNNGLAIMQGIELEGEDRFPILATKLIHDSGESIRHTYPLYTKDLSDPQKLASAVTYARRYSLMAMFNLAAEDDDGNAAANAGTKGSGSSAQPTNGPSAAQKGKAKALLTEVRQAKSKAAGDKITTEMFGKAFDDLTGREMSKLIDDLLTEQKGPGF